MNEAETTPGTLNSLGVANALAAEMLRRATCKVDAAAKANGYPVPADVFDAYEQASRDVHVTLLRVLTYGPPVDTEVYTPDGKMIVAQALVLTSDGGRMIREWHDGPMAEDAVRYERYSLSGERVAHGWIDPVSRKIVQTG